MHDGAGKKKTVIHPDSVERLTDQGSAMRFYESSRALKGDEKPEMANVARCMERTHLHQQRKAWIKKHGSLWAVPDPCPVVQIHPAATLAQVLRHSITWLWLCQISWCSHSHYFHMTSCSYIILERYKCIGTVDPEGMSKYLQSTFPGTTLIPKSGYFLCICVAMTRKQLRPK